MSPGAKLTVIMAGVTSIVLALRWLLQRLVGPPPVNREAPPEVEFDVTPESGAPESYAPHHDGPSNDG